ncbi:MAG TPA: protein kinase [Pyrinomonadaceae bacterium]
MPTIEADRWRRIEEIFHLALEYESAAREDFLAGMCSEDLSLLGEVRSLISSHEQSGEFLDKPELTTGLQLLAVHNSLPRDGQTISHYLLKNRIGLGGMGEVYLALDRQLVRNVALKLLPAPFNDHPGWVCRFQNEARAASSIAHPNIAHVYEVGESDGQHYIAMEYIEGQTLREHLKRAPLKPYEAIDITIQVARALAAAHSAGMLHRDIKPDNIMIQQDGFVKVLDFGLAKSTAGLESQHQAEGIAVSGVKTAAGIIVGSPAYMSPEQARGLEVDGRSDLWSLGVVLYELLTQKNPFLSDTPSDTIAAILKTDPPPASLWVPELPEGLERIVTKLLAKAVEDRYQSAGSLIVDLSNLGEELERRENLKHQGTDAEVNNSNAVPSFVLNQQRSKIFLKGVASIKRRIRTASKTFKFVISTLLLIALTIPVMLRYSGYPVTETQSPSITSIAVLPFTNVTSDPNNEYICDGLSESLIERFSRLSRIKVIARGSSFTYKKRAPDLKNIARDLNVQALIIGTVTRQGDGLQVSVQLLDANQASQLWTKRYQYKASDLPIILNDITQKIAAELNLGLSPEELNLLTRDQRGAHDAYELYLKGRFYWNQLTEESLDKSIECFNEVLAIDPQYALAYAGLASSYSTLGANYRSSEEAFRKAELNAQKALEIDGDLAEAHYAMGMISYMYYWDLQRAERELRRALELNPNYAMANSMLCALSLTKGDVKQATGHINRALELDPLSLLFNVRLYGIYYFQRDYERANRLQQKILNEHEEASFVYNDIAIAYALMNRFDEALAASQRAVVLMGQDPDTLSTLGIIYALSGRLGDARWVAGRLEQLSQNRHVPAYTIAAIYSAIGDRNQAFVWLNKATEQRSSQMLLIRLDPIFDKVRSDPRYAQLLKSINLDNL